MKKSLVLPLRTTLSVFCTLNGSRKNPPFCAAPHPSGARFPFKLILSIILSNALLMLFLEFVWVATCAALRRSDCATCRPERERRQHWQARVMPSSACRPFVHNTLSNVVELALSLAFLICSRVDVPLSGFTSFSSLFPVLCPPTKKSKRRPPAHGFALRRRARYVNTAFSVFLHIFVCL